MKRVIVIGCAGSGKSHFSKELRDKIGFPLYHLDRIFWREDGGHIEKDELCQRLREIMQSENWIIDGNYNSTMEMRMQACDTVFFFDLPVEICLEGIKERKGKPRDDMAWQSPPEDDDVEFVEFIKNYNTVNRPRVLELLDKNREKNVIIFHKREEADAFLNNLKK